MALELENMDTAFPGKVEKVNKDGSVDCRPAICKVSSNGAFDTDNSVIPAIPVMKIGSANAEFSFPIKEGDDVLLVAFSRDASKWRIDGDKGDVVPNSAGGLSLMDLVAIPFVRASCEGKAKIRVTDEGDIVLTPANGRKTVCESDLVCDGSVMSKGDVLSIGEVAAGCIQIGDEWNDATAIHLKTHIHPTGVGPSSPPVTGS